MSTPHSSSQAERQLVTVSASSVKNTLIPFLTRKRSKNGLPVATHAARSDKSVVLPTPGPALISLMVFMLKRYSTNGFGIVGRGLIRNPAGVVRGPSARGFGSPVFSSGSSTSGDSSAQRANSASVYGGA
ncbi:hypothetical protein D3C80_1462010 [compost metagenome]